MLVKFASFFNPKAKLFIQGRKGIFNTISDKLINEKAERIWFHCASLGEFDQALPVIELIKKNNPEYKILVTFFSPSGYESRKNHKSADYIFYLPLDSFSNAKKFIQIVRPAKAFFVKYEFWYYFINELNRNNIPFYLLSCNFNSDHQFFKWYASFFRGILKRFEIIFAQNETTQKLLNANGIQNVIVSKDTRFDKVYRHIHDLPLLPIIALFKQNKLLITAGSSYEKEATLLHDFLLKSEQNIKLILAPHEIDKAHIDFLLDLYKDKKTLLYSDANELNIQHSDVLIINNIGLLSSIYRYSDIAFIGGGFGKKGLHNMLEAAAYGMPIIFGPKNIDRFPEAQMFIDNQVAFVINDMASCSIVLNKLINDSNKRIHISTIARGIISENVGASQIVYDRIFCNQ